MKCVLVTGGSRGIGRAAVCRLADMGYCVAFTYNTSREDAFRLASDTGALAIRADCRVRDDIESAVEQVLERYRKIDVLINNAGISLDRLVIDTSDEEYRNVMDTNLYGVFATMRAVLPCMIRRRSGSIINISSMWGIAPAANEAIYSASKAAVIALTRATANEVASAGVRINCIAPGVIDTGMNSVYTEKELMGITDRIPQGRIGTVDNVVDGIMFLAEDVSSYVTGQVLGINGGMVY